MLTEGIASLTDDLLWLDLQCHYLSLSIQLQRSSFVAHYLRCSPPQKSRAVLPSFNLFICHSEEERKSKLKGRQQQSIRQVLGIPHIVAGTSPDLPYPMFNDVLITASPESQDFQGVGGLCCKVFQRAKPYSGEKKTGT